MEQIKSTHKCKIHQHLVQTLRFMAAIGQGQEPQSSWPLPLVMGAGGGDWKDKRDGGDGGVGGSSSSTGTGPGADSPEGAPWSA